MTTHQIPQRPMTTAEAVALGWTRGQLRALVAEGSLRQDLYGVYVPGDWPDDASTRAAAAAHVMPPHTVVVDRSAASLHGINVFDFAEVDVAPRLEVVAVDAEASRRTGVLGGKRDLLPNEIETLHGIRVTTPVRTACDIACLRGRRRALATLDAFRELYDLDEVDLVRMLGRFAGRRGVTQLRELIPLSRTGVDSQPESWIRLDLHDNGYPMPQTQQEIYVPGHGMRRVENAYPSLRIAVEYDGEEAHSEESDMEHDATRRRMLEDEAGWRIVVVRRDGLTVKGTERWLREFDAIYQQRAPVEWPRRRYARSPVKFYPRPKWG